MGTQCESGQRYFSGTCANVTRRSLQCDAGARYQQSASGDTNPHNECANLNCAAPPQQRL